MQDLNDYFYYAAVVSHRGFAAAGRALNQPKSKLSKRIGSLEARLGVRLIERSSRRFQVTQVGEAFYDRCTVILSEAQQAEELASTALGEPSGMIRFSCPEGHLARPLASILPAFLARYPRVQLQVISTDRQVDLTDEKIDLVMRVSTVMEQDAALTTRVLARARRVLVASPALVAKFGPFKSIADLSRAPTLTMPNWVDHDTWHFIGSKGEDVAFDHVPRLTFVDFEAQRRAAVAGIGIGLLPDRGCERDLVAGRLVHLLPEWQTREATVFLAYTTRRGLRPAVRALINHLVEHFGEAADAYSAVR